MRYSAYVLSIAGLLVSLPVTLWLGAGYLFPVIFGALTALGTWDLLQRKHTVSRNYPIMANFRYLFESIGPEIRQYFIQSDTEERPFSREQRTIIYQRAKNVLDKRPFGSQLGMYDEGFEWMNHSLTPPTRLDSSDFRILIGKNCEKPYGASVFNISAMSFGSLSANAILSLNTGAKKGGFYTIRGGKDRSPATIGNPVEIWSGKSVPAISVAGIPTAPSMPRCSKGMPPWTRSK